MYRVLIVDDEPFVREGLKALIDWEKYGYEICGEAENGEEGIEKIKDLNPDLVITDIRMPEIGGLEMIKKISNEMDNKPRFVVLSGYSDFDYARTAIRFNVNDYLLKPIEQKELIEAISKIRNELKEEAINQRRKADSANALISQGIQKLIHGQGDSTCISFTTEFINIKEEEQFTYIQLHLTGFKQCIDNQEGEETDKQLEAMHRLIKKTLNSSYISLHEDQLNVYGLFVNSESLKGFNGDVTKFSKHVLNMICEKTNLDIDIYIGETVDKLSDIGVSYKSCIEARQRNFFQQKKGVIHFDELREVNFIYRFEDSSPFKELVEAVELCNDEQIINVIMKVFNKMNNELLAPEVVKAEVASFALEVIKVILTKEDNVDDLDTYLSVLSLDRHSFIELQERLIKFSIAAGKYIKSMERRRGNSLLYEIEKYVKNNFDKEVSLKSLSEMFYINPVYLGQLFKKNYGTYFNDFLHGIRIEEAKKLLRRTNYKVYEVANKVGYSDSNYFLSKFEKITGVTPTQYKRNIEGEK